MQYVRLRREADAIAQELRRFLNPLAQASDAAPVDPEDFREMVWAGEAKIGTETLCEQLEENEVILPARLAQRIRALGVEVGVDKSYLDRINAEEVEDC